MNYNHQAWYFQTLDSQENWLSLHNYNIGTPV